MTDGAIGVDSNPQEPADDKPQLPLSETYGLHTPKLPAYNGLPGFNRPAKQTARDVAQKAATTLTGCERTGALTLISHKTGHDFKTVEGGIKTIEPIDQQDAYFLRDKLNERIDRASGNILPLVTATIDTEQSVGHVTNMVGKKSHLFIPDASLSQVATILKHTKFTPKPASNHVDAATRGPDSPAHAL